MPITPKEYIRLTPRILDELSQSARAGVNAAAREVTRQARIAVAQAIGADLRLSHMPRSKQIKPWFKAAKSAENPVAICGVSGPAHLIERPRKGGYQVKPRRKQAVVVETFEALGLSAKQALRTPEGPRAGVKPGPITNPLAPVTKTFARADRIIQKVAEDAVHGRFHRNGWGD